MTTPFTEGFAEELLFKVEDAIIEGDGAGKPKGEARCKLCCIIGWVTITLFAVWFLFRLMVWPVGIPNPEDPGIFYYQECRAGRTLERGPTSIPRTISRKADAELCKDIP